CWRRLKLWEEQGVWLKIWRTFLTELNDRGRIRWSECFMDATFIPAKKGVSTSERRARAKAQSLWYWQTARVFLWEFPSIVLARVRPSLRQRRSRRSEEAAIGTGCLGRTPIACAVIEDTRPSHSDAG